VVHLTLRQRFVELLPVGFAGIGYRGHLAFKLASGTFLPLGILAVSPLEFSPSFSDTPALIAHRRNEQGTPF
jgi:hypothetical protein